MKPTIVQWHLSSTRYFVFDRINKWRGGSNSGSYWPNMYIRHGAKIQLRWNNIGCTPLITHRSTSSRSVIGFTNPIGSSESRCYDTYLEFRIPRWGTIFVFFCFFFFSFAKRRSFPFPPVYSLMKRRTQTKGELGRSQPEKVPSAELLSPQSFYGFL